MKKSQFSERIFRNESLYLEDCFSLKKKTIPTLNKSKFINQLIVFIKKLNIISRE